MQTEIIGKSVELSISNGEFFTWEIVKYLGYCKRGQNKIRAK